MKKCVMVALLIASLLVPVFGQLKADYQMKIEYTAEQVNIPYEGYYAAYLVNTSNTTMTLFYCDDTVLDFIEYPDKFGAASFTAVKFTEADNKKAGKGLVFKPGDKLLLYSKGFSPEAREQNREMIIYVYVRGIEKRVEILL